MTALVAVLALAAGGLFAVSAEFSTRPPKPPSKPASATHGSCCDWQAVQHGSWQTFWT